MNTNNLRGLADSYEQFDGVEYRVDRLGDAYEIVKAFDSRKFDEIAPPSCYQIDEDDGLLYEIGNGGLFGKAFNKAVVNEHAIGQMIDRILPNGGLRRNYIYDTCPIDLAATNMNHWLSQFDKPMTFRFYGGGADTTLLRSVNGPRFNTHLDNAPILNSLMMIEKRDGTPLFYDDMALARSYVGRDSMRVQFKLVDGIQLPDLPNGGRSYYAAGIALRNNEIGSGAYWANVIVWRIACDNSITMPSIFPHVRVTHYSNYEAANAISLTVDMMGQILTNEEYNFEKMFNHMAQAAMDELTTSGKLDAIDAALDALRLGDNNRDALIQISDKYASTRLGMVNAFTEFSQMLADRNKTEALDAIAGDYLFGLPIRRVPEYEMAELE